MPNAVPSMPQRLLAVMQQGLPSDTADPGHLGASGAGAVHVPETTYPHELDAASKQHAVGVTLLRAVIAIGAVHFELPHITLDGAEEGAEMPPSAAGTPALLEPAPLPAAVLDVVTCAASLLLHAVASMLANNHANLEFRTFIIGACTAARYCPGWPRFLDLAA